MTRTMRENLMWAAGFFDGEGSTSPQKDRHGKHRAVIQINQVDSEALYRFRDAVGHGKVYGPYKETRGHQDFYHFAATSFEDVYAIVAKLWGFIGTPKRKQMMRALRVDHRRRHGRYSASPTQRSC